MSEYTMELKQIAEYLELGLDKYPIFDEAYREQLNQKIKDHFWFHEIGYETPERFIFELNRKMAEVMPLYNQYYESELLAVDPLLTFSKTQNLTKDVTKDVDTTKDTERDMTNATDKIDLTVLTNDTVTDSTKTSDELTDITNTNSVTTVDDIDETNAEKLVGSDTPTDQLLVGDIDTNVYATTANVNESTRANDSTRTVTEDLAQNKDGLKTDVINETVNNDQTLNTNSDLDTVVAEDINEVGSMAEVGNETVVNTESGFEQNMSKLLKEYRTTFLNVDMMVINSLNTLFFKVRGSWFGGEC